MTSILLHCMHGGGEDGVESLIVEGWLEVEGGRGWYGWWTSHVAVEVRRGCADRDGSIVEHYIHGLQCCMG